MNEAIKMKKSEKKIEPKYTHASGDYYSKKHNKNGFILYYIIPDNYYFYINILLLTLIINFTLNANYY